MTIETAANPMPATPFVGLNPFRTEEAILFFGRRPHTIELLQMLRQTRFIGVVGSSGSGKSSLIRAGLIPQLKAGFLVEARDRWRVAVMKPGDAPIKNLAQSLTDTEDLSEGIRNGGAMAIVDALQPLLKQNDENLLLVVDQFEELFRFGIESGQADKRDEAGDFVSILLELAAQSDLPCFVVLTMRSDFIGDCDHFYGLPEALNRSQFLVPRLTREQRRQAIEGPIRLFNADITPRLLDRVVNDAGDHSDQLPVMQHALMRTWEQWRKSGDSKLDLRHYEVVGTIKQALNWDAEAALTDMPKAELEITEKMFQALTDTDGNRRYVRRPVRLSEVQAISNAGKDAILQIIARFCNANRAFLTLSNDADPIVDISHESLIRQWGRLREWIAKEAESRTIYYRISDRAYLYQRGETTLLTGIELKSAHQWWKKNSPTPAWAARYRMEYPRTYKFYRRSHRFGMLKKVLIGVTIVLILSFAFQGIVERWKALTVIAGLLFFTWPLIFIFFVGEWVKNVFIRNVKQWRRKQL